MEEQHQHNPTPGDPIQTFQASMADPLKLVTSLPFVFRALHALVIPKHRRPVPGI